MSSVSLNRELNIFFGTEDEVLEAFLLEGVYHDLSL